ncbi:hypothetical protein PTSG_13240 [Salpingoeca rosetta]|uniref:Purple acid phosphatase n=1 Tax=Salpingoeca rosetta (strain ATCC 50818 / BSB-021) TaxID=946362 RepID=F2U2E4_SALR5|nr:uncharacterized protein PTSG_13240 [Salpingoeca rosetta]EGD81796.1 hypothetical protein PTSG_13240 [Salpingoeca rosetta]|eukprot:XP_004997000.1 hypothetical protein PTSG_13240 [Salpingoeca rosetta]
MDYPATAPWTATATVKYQYCKVSPDFYSTGSGSYRFNLINMRDDVVFWLLFGGIDKPRAIAKTSSISFNDTEVPKQIVTALTGDPTEMRVTWNSASGTGAKLRYGINGQSKVHTIDANTTTYTRDDLCGAPATTQGWRDPGYFHTAIIKGLKPGKSVVWYQCFSNNTWSTVHTFTAAKPADAKASLHIVATADVGAAQRDGCHYHWETPDANLTYMHMGEHGAADLALHIGDISYATGYASKWDVFMTQASPLAAATPLMTALGNHEQDFPGKVYYNSVDSGGECGIPTVTRFPMPTPTGDQQKGWYSFDMGPVHFLMMDTELECGPGSEQYKFFQKDLSSVDRNVTPWIVFGGHRPMYYVLEDGSHIDPHFQVLEPLLVKHQVDLILVGHVHNALRTCPVNNGTCQQPSKQGGYDAPIHVCIGNGGMGLTKIPETRAAWTEYQAYEWGYSTIDVNATHLHMQLFADESNELHHEFTIERSFPRDMSATGVPRRAAV